jgi:hypothetical protein
MFIVFRRNALSAEGQYCRKRAATQNTKSKILDDRQAEGRKENERAAPNFKSSST